MYRVFRVPPGQVSKIEDLLRDDLVGRQSITRREAKSLGLSGEGVVVLVEGSEAGVKRAAALMPEVPSLEGKAAEDIYRRLRAEDDDAASGLGLVFGG